MPLRRIVLLRGASVLVIALAWTARLRAEGVHDTILAMGRYLQAVVGLFAGVNDRVEGIDVAGLDAGVRSELRVEIEALAEALDRLVAPKSIFVEDLRGYLQRARNRQFDSEAQRRNAWQQIQREVEGIADAANDVLAIVSRPDSRLRLVVADADRLSLSTTMRTRGLLLRRFPAVAPLATPGELSALEFMVEQHERLLQTTKQFRLTLEGKRRTLLA